MAVIFDVSITQSDFALIAGHAPRKNHVASRYYFGRQPIFIIQIHVHMHRYRPAITNKTPPRRDHVPLSGMTFYTQPITGHIHDNHLNTHTILGSNNSRNLHWNPLMKPSFHYINTRYQNCLKPEEFSLKK